MNVIGPYDHADFRTMQMIKGMIAYMEKNNKDGKYSLSIKGDKACLQDYFQEGVAA